MVVVRKVPVSVERQGCRAAVSGWVASGASRGLPTPLPPINLQRGWPRSGRGDASYRLGSLRGARIGTLAGFVCAVLGRYEIYRAYRCRCRGNQAALNSGMVLEVLMKSRL